MSLIFRWCFSKPAKNNTAKIQRRQLSSSSSKKNETAEPTIFLFLLNCCWPSTARGASHWHVIRLVMYFRWKMNASLNVYARCTKINRSHNNCQVIMNKREILLFSKYTLPKIMSFTQNRNQFPIKDLSIKRTIMDLTKKFKLQY